MDHETQYQACLGLKSLLVVGAKRNDTIRAIRAHVSACSICSKVPVATMLSHTAVSERTRREAPIAHLFMAQHIARALT
jgi:hypothetical protein